MATVAFIGPDGTGKTTLTRRLEQSGLLPFKYLYMGVNLDPANVLLPSTRLVANLKRRLGHAGIGSGNAPGTSGGGRRLAPPSWLWRAARFTNHLVDEWVRQVVSWYYQARGYVVLYDRHFVFDFSPQIVAGRDAPADRRAHHWLVTRAYPRPDLVFFLDAPGDVLFARKGESTPEELERRRRGFMTQGTLVPNFIRVDATRPLDDVYQEIVAHLTVYFKLQPPSSGARDRRDHAAGRPASGADEVMS